ncbi:dephospho-CoA kinase [Putridiphycobacter roseus]|uniref:Dephospho-CoA kinase n=1 Tax=Putridiphycobacter roseus TaxID=2219161 RepID=A0A2W1NMZ0_9FLAO|nr:dephospho-CoA kinase [Putridiphycobacter roseus]PZE17042.1 dephospho-CoA kinase [Putridiphycobacter roseus]
MFTIKQSVGITGGIGSGKTYVARILESMGYPVFYSDQVSKSLLATSPEIIKAVTKLLGTKAYFEDGTVNKAYVAGKIFSDQDLLLQMNAIMHPAVRNAFQTFFKNQNAPLVFNEAAILFETGAHENLDKTILVVAPEKVRIERVLKRENISIAQVKERIEKQWADEKKLALSDYIIKNGNNDMLLPQINEILQSLLNS